MLAEVRGRADGRPVAILAHSMGGCVALLAALDGALPFRRLVTAQAIFRREVIE